MQRLSDFSAVDMLQFISQEFGTKAVFSTSFGLEDQVLAHLIFGNNLQIEVFTLDTGRLFPETYSVWSRTLEKYGKSIKTLHPDAEQLATLVSRDGPNGFYRSVENRLECCRIRKTEPLRRGLLGKEVWITGIRQEQSANRETMSWIEWDEVHDLWKIHPLFYWTETEVKEFIKLQQVPFNSLHDKGFPSIGCAPCTRAVAPGEHPRAGRWWWEEGGKKECGLHRIQKL